MARRHKKIDKFEESCTRIRLQLLYLDEVNDVGLELTKLQHQLGLCS